MCNVRDCASSAKSVVIVFDDDCDVLEKTMKVTVLSLPKENGVLVKINVIELICPQINLFLAKMIVLDFTGVCFDAIMHPYRVTSKKAETSVTESPGNKGLWVERCSYKSLFHQNSSLSEMHFMVSGKAVYDCMWLLLYFC